MMPIPERDAQPPVRWAAQSIHARPGEAEIRRMDAWGRAVEGPVGGPMPIKDAKKAAERMNRKEAQP